VGATATTRGANLAYQSRDVHYATVRSTRRKSKGVTVSRHFAVTAGSKSPPRAPSPQTSAEFPARVAAEGVQTVQSHSLEVAPTTIQNSTNKQTTRLLVIVTVSNIR